MHDRIEFLPEKAGRAYAVREVRQYLFLALGASLALLLAGALLAVLSRLDGTLLNVAFLLAIGGGALVITLAWLAKLRRRGPDDEVFIVAPYAFEIHPSTLEFPGTIDSEPESWQRSGTHAHVASRLGTDILFLENADHGRRSFGSRQLKENPNIVLMRLAGREAPRRGA